MASIGNFLLLRLTPVTMGVILRLGMFAALPGRTVLSGAIRASFDPVAAALGLTCRIEREDWVLYAQKGHSLAVHCEPLKGETLVRLVRRKDVFDLAELLDTAGRAEDAQSARQRVESPLDLPARFELMAQLAHEMGAFLWSKDRAFYRRTKRHHNEDLIRPESGGYTSQYSPRGDDMDDKPWRDDAQILTRGSEDEERLLGLVDAAGQHAKAGNLDAAAKSLEEFRKVLVQRGHFRSYDNDIWVFTDIIHCIRRLSHEEKPPKAYQRFLDAPPRGGYDQEMSSSQRAFWYGDPDAQYGGQVKIVP